VKYTVLRGAGQTQYDMKTCVKNIYENVKNVCCKRKRKKENEWLDHKASKHTAA